MNADQHRGKIVDALEVSGGNWDHPKVQETYRHAIWHDQIIRKKFAQRVPKGRRAEIIGLANSGIALTEASVSEKLSISKIYARNMLTQICREGGLVRLCGTYPDISYAACAAEREAEVAQ